MYFFYTDELDWILKAEYSVGLMREVQTISKEISYGFFESLCINTPK